MTACLRRESPFRESVRVAAALSLLCACASEPSNAPSPEPREEWIAGDATTSVADAPAAAPTRSGGAATSSGGGAYVADEPRSDRADAVDSMLRPPWRDPVKEKSYLIPAMDIVGFEFLLNQFDRRYVDHSVYASGTGSIRRNLHRGWIIDKDPFSENQFGHPYSGSIYHGFARSAGLSYWEALGYDFGGSALWEIAGETGPASLNDQINTTFAGSFLGEALFRTANLILGGDGKPGVGRQAAAALVSPSSAFNRYAWDDQFAGVYPSHDPATFYWLGVGVGRNTTITDLGVLTNARRDRVQAAFSLDYGLPGKRDYTYDRPFDYFHFEGSTTANANAFPENLSVRGLLYGTSYEPNRDCDGVWGLYGTYDYFSPEIFKASSTGLGVGTTVQCPLSQKFTLQGSIVAGGGFTAAGTTSHTQTDREYHYGFGPQGLVALRMIYDDRAMLDFTTNDYVLAGGAGSTGTSGTENVLRAQIALTIRVYDHHAVGIQFVEARRDPTFAGLPNPRQSVGELSIFYTFLGDSDFGVVRK